MKNNTDFPGHSVIIHLKKSLFTFYKKQGNQLAASIAYFTTLSFIPVLFFLLSAAGWILTINEKLQDQILKYFHGIIPGWEQTFEMSATYLKSNVEATGLIGLVLFFLSGRSLLASINFAFDTVLDEESNKPLGKLLLDTLLVFGAFLLFVTFTVLWNVGLHNLQNLQLIGPIASVILMGAQYQFILGWLLGTVAFSILYKILPTSSFSFTVILISAGYASAIWEVFKLLFSNYFLHFAQQNAISGSISSIVYAILWAYLFGLSLVLGICMAKEISSSSV